MGAPSNWDVGVEDLKALLDAKADFRLIDVREDHEVESCSVGGELIHLASLTQRLGEDQNIGKQNGPIHGKPL